MELSFGCPSQSKWRDFRLERLELPILRAFTLGGSWIWERRGEYYGMGGDMYACRFSAVKRSLIVVV